jgi:hypothetical protein
MTENGVVKGLARGCITGLLGLAAAIAAFHFWFQALGLEKDVPDLGSVMAGFFTTLSIWMLWSVGDVLRDRALLRGAIEGVPPVDGKWAGFSGVIRASSPLTSPMSRTSAVAYTYEIREHDWTRYEGMALAASTISTSLGSYRLLAVPVLDFSNPAPDASTARRNAEAYIAATRFETLETAQADRQTAQMEWTDDDGAFRRDRKGNDVINISRCSFAEQVIAQGEQVCVLGLYSEARGGIIPDPNWARQTQLMRGDGETGIRRLGSRARNYIIAAFVFAAAAAGVCWAVIKMHWRP